MFFARYWLAVPVLAIAGALAAKKIVPATSGTLFFFSSRRRHTRSLCDWSSDVCSSDLGSGRDGHENCAASGFADPHVPRSEERRVGKECRSRWWRYNYKKKINIDKI